MITASSATVNMGELLEAAASFSIVHFLQSSIKQRPHTESSSFHSHELGQCLALDQLHGAITDCHVKMALYIQLSTFNIVNIQLSNK